LLQVKLQVQIRLTVCINDLLGMLTGVRSIEYRLMTIVCQSVCLSVRLCVTCLNVSREWKGIVSWKLAGVKPTTRAIRDPI